jgi:hypothetical protein
MHLESGDIIPEALHRRLGWDIRHHFMAEKIIDRYGLKLPRDRELVRQLAVFFVLSGLKRPPLEGEQPKPLSRLHQASPYGSRQRDALSSRPE